MTIRLRIWLATLVGAALLFAGMIGVLYVLVRWVMTLTFAAQVWLVLAASTLIVLAIFAPIAWLLASLAYAPVRDVTKTADSILNTGELDRRCFYAGPHDDVGRLVVVVNELLVRYDAALGALHRLRAAPPGCTCPRQEPVTDPADLVLDLERGRPSAEPR
jgi:hypothetical protein